MKNVKSIAFMISFLFHGVALAVFIKYWDPVREFLKTSPATAQESVASVSEAIKPSTAKALLREAVLQQRSEIEICYDDFLRREPSKPNGSIAVQWEVDSNGSVVAAEVTETNIADLDLEECVLQGVSKMHFSPKEFTKDVRFSYRFHFKARAPAAVNFQ